MDDLILLIAISIHALRVEGDAGGEFPTLPAGDFYPRPPGGGRLAKHLSFAFGSSFLSTPSGWRATAGWKAPCPHSFGFLSTPSGWRATRREQSQAGGRYDFYPRPPGGGRRRARRWQSATTVNFYPRPPGGGRPRYSRGRQFWAMVFLSTPSGWRATPFIELHKIRERKVISIHALRVEGDFQIIDQPQYFYKFLSTPSGWRATGTLVVYDRVKTISIHALRVEGDLAARRL